jgi:uncharacterized DUF497 family protein
MAYKDGMRFEWAPEKDRANFKKHGLSFDEAATLFTRGVDYLEIYDEKHNEQEDRFIGIGPIARGIIVVVYTERTDDLIRIISARLATKKEVRLFREQERS